MKAPEVGRDVAPAAWLRDLVKARRAEHADGEPEPAGTWVSRTSLLGGEPTALRMSFDRLVADGTPTAPAAMYLAGWFAGAVAERVGVVLAAGRAAVALDPASLRWLVHPDGWPLDVSADAIVTVASEHPWAGRDDVTVVADVDAVIATAVAALVEAVAPIVDAIRALAPVGRAGLWNEVADALGTVLVYQHTVEPTADRTALLERALRQPGVPWRARPTLWFVDTERFGRLHVGRKGGCCLAYTQPSEPADPTDPDLDADHRAYLERFPTNPAQPDYCSTCSFRDLDDTAARQIFWHERRR